MVYEKFSNEEDKKDIDMLLKNVEELHKPKLGGKDISGRGIINYAVNLLKPCNSFLIDPRLYEVVKNHFLEDPGQMLRITGELAAKIAYNALNGVDSHNTTLSVLRRILQQFPWETKAILPIASFILTYGDNNGLNLRVDSKIVVENGVHHFIKGLLRISNYFVAFETLPISFMSSEDPLVVDAMRQLMIVVYSITRVVVVAASSKLMTRSSIGDMEDKYGKSGSTWCSTNLDFIEEQLYTINNLLKLKKVTSDMMIKEEEDEEEVRYSYLVDREATVENFDVKR